MIANAFNIDGKTFASKAIREYRAFNISPKETANIYNLYKQGLSINEISRQTHREWHTCKSAILHYEPPKDKILLNGK